ncbi:hypothetical protein Gasu2_66640 [Galdieria sulphuraria]|uniref:Nuclear receptor co-repressor 1 n=1 Tax=Galdieria sulphuraria TaxID=130081 RepID=M2XT91_GALSU|nr:nuclear receptor co-repressor 1 [Galdieria sulphuraria]EME26853.1 nuclear receptor co-repressor 1 [Galdieria sulphuraria]GJD12589.1 hypothetical protein Gasu2_66640 [Galdieria sulphuraria]|eukprot:XP_005703373.1 nuclear receptor co-repressor 1 [Galdieria sulphuraria]
MSQSVPVKNDTEDSCGVQKLSNAVEEPAGEGQLANTTTNTEALNFTTLPTSNKKLTDRLFSCDSPSSQVAVLKEQTPQGNLPSYSAFTNETKPSLSKINSSEELKKKIENINMRVRFLQSQLAAKEAALESRKDFLSHREQLAAKSIPISCSTRKTLKIEPPEPLDVTVNRIQAENARRISESHRLLDYNLSGEDFTSSNIYGLLQEGTLEIQGSEESNLRSHLESSIQKEKDAQLEKIKTLREEYFTLKDAWIERIKKMDRQRSKEGNSSSSRERDVWLVRATRGTDVVKATRNRGPSSSPTNGSSSDETDSRLESNNGKQVNGYDKHSQNSTTAVIPGQVSLFQPFEGGNVLYENPIVEAYFDALVNPWTRAERIVFLKKFLQFGKNFRKIATFLEYKTTEDVVRYYFKNKLKLNLKLLAREYIGSRQQSWKASSAILATSGFPADSVTRRWMMDNFKALKNKESLNNVSDCNSGYLNWRRDSRAPHTLASITGTSFEMQTKKILREHGLQSISEDHTPTFENSTVCIPVGRDGYISPCYVIEKIKVRQQKENLTERRRSGVWKVQGKIKKMDVKKYRWTNKEKNVFFKLLKELGCDWEKISEQIPTKSPLQLRAFYDEYVSQKATEVSEGDSTNPNSPSIASDGEMATFTRSLRKRKESQENLSTKRFRRVVGDNESKEDLNDADSYAQDRASVSHSCKTERFLSEDKMNSQSSFDRDISKVSIPNDLKDEQKNVEDDANSDDTSRIRRRTLNVHDLLSE